MITFIHTADVHFGMENYGRIDPATGIHSRLLDFDRAFNSCIDTALERNIDFFLFAGDAYKTTHPSPTQQRLFLKALLRLYKAKIPVVMVLGNHDNPLSFGKAHTLELFGELPLDGFHVIAKPTTVSLETKNGPVNIVGIPWPTRNSIALDNHHAHSSPAQLSAYISQGVSSIIAHLAQQLDPQVPAVLAGHLTVSSGIFSGSEKRAIYGSDPIFMPSQLAISPFDYVALGHLHRHQQLNPDGQPPIVYSGSIERIDFGERKEDKGFCLVTIAQKGATAYEFIKTPMRTFIQLEVTLNHETDHTETILNALSKHSIQDAVIKIIYHVPHGMKERVDSAKIQKACSSALYIVGIFPIRHLEHRSPRKQLSAVMDLPTLLNNYFETKPEYKDKKASLIETALNFAQKAHDLGEEI